MKKIIYSVVLMLGMVHIANSQNVGINTTGNAANNSAMLDVSAADKGVLVPRIELSALNVSAPIISPETSLLVYNTVTSGVAPNMVTPGFYYWTGSEWSRVIHGNTAMKGQNGVNVSTTAPNANVNDRYMELGGSLVRNTTITQAANTLAFTSTAVNGFSVDGNSFSVDAANDRVGIGTAMPLAKLDVNGNIHLGSSTGNKYISTWEANDENWRIGMSATPGFARALSTSHVQYLTYHNGNGQGFAVGVNGGNSSFEINGANHNAYFRGYVGIGAINPIQELDVNGRINVNGGVIQRGGPAITATADLGLYSRISGNWIRYVTNASRHAFFVNAGTDGAGTGNTAFSIESNGNILVDEVKPIMIRNYVMAANVSNIDHNTGVSASTYRAVIAGFNQGSYDMQENDTRQQDACYMEVVGGVWWIRARANSHNNAADWTIQVMFIKNQLVDDQR